MSRAARALGPDAVILSNRPVDGVVAILAPEPEFAAAFASRRAAPEPAFG